MIQPGLINYMMAIFMRKRVLLGRLLLLAGLGPVATVLAMPNPASEYCSTQGHKLIFLQETGFCRFADNSYCEEWHYYRAECFPGQHFWPAGQSMPARQDDYCITRESAGTPLVVLCRAQNQQLIQALQQQRLQGFLALDDYQLKPEEQVQVFNALKTNTSVKSLSIKQALSPQGLAALAAMLAQNRTLTSLTLQQQTLTETAATLLAQALSSNPKLQELNLASNNLGDKVFAEIFPLLISNTRLQSLDLANNRLTSKSEPVLVAHLTTNQSLLMLNLSFNLLGNHLGERLLKLIAYNNTLIQLGLQKTAISEPILAKIKAILTPRFHDSPCLLKNRS